MANPLPPNLPIPPAGAEPGNGFDAEDPFMPDNSTPQRTTQPNPLIAPPQIDESITSQDPVFKKPEAPVSQSNQKKVVIGIIGSVALLLVIAIVLVVSRIMSLQGSLQASPSPIPTLEPASSIEPSSPAVVASPVLDGAADLDADGITNAEEELYKTDPSKADTDGDTYSDGEEVKNGYNPIGAGKLDSDNDGFPDPDERKFGTDPYNPDSDGDGYSDGDEIDHGHNPIIPSPNDKL